VQNDCKIQRTIAALIKAEPDGAWAYEHLVERIYGTARFTRAQKNAIGRALAAMRLPGTWAVRQASFNNDRRFWLFDPCRLHSWRKGAGPRWDPAHFQPGGAIFKWTLADAPGRGLAPAPIRHIRASRPAPLS
jgi:hypothetical protein